MAQQHKKCSELLRLIYESPKNELISHYNEIQSWMEGPALDDCDRESIAQRYHHHLALANVQWKEHHLLPRVREGDHTQASADWLPVTIYLDDLRSAHNVGSIIRSTEAFRLGEIALSPKTPDLKHTQVKKAAMGSDQWVKIQIADDLDALPQPVIAIETVENAPALGAFVFPHEPFTLVLGNEETGCSRTVLEKAETVVEIPLQGCKNSLNVAAAFSIVAYEIRRQRS